MDKHHYHYQPVLDGLRGFAALNVLVSHYSNASGLFDKMFAQGAKASFMLFFMLSSYLMFSLYHEIQENRRQAALVFLQNRFARIFPLFALVIFISYLFWYVLPPLNCFGINNKNALKHLLLIKSQSVLWSIKPEVIFYSAFFVFLYLPRSLSRIAILFASLMILTAFDPFKNILFPHVNDVLDKPFVYPYFLLGMLLYFFQRFIEKHGKAVVLPIGLDLLLSILIFSSFFISYPEVYYAVFGANPSAGGWDSPLTALLLSMLFLGSLWLRCLKRIFSTKFLVFIGEISFSTYLLHMFIIKAFNYYGITKPHLINLILFLTVVIAIATLSYYYFEKRTRQFLRFRKKITLPPHSKPIVATGT